MSSRYSLYEGESYKKEKCRACTDFKAFAKQQEKIDQRNQENDNKKAECPLDRSEVGRSTWGLLHTMAAHFPDNPTQAQQRDMGHFFQLLAQFYPCRECADDFAQDVRSFPPATESGDSLSAWLCRMHNRVNRKLGKPLFDCAQVRQRWRDGWTDGSCDS